MTKRTRSAWLSIVGSGLLVLVLLWISINTLSAAAASAKATAKWAKEMAAGMPPFSAAAPTAPTATDWCLAGSFQGWNNASDPLNDAGSSGDLIPADGVYSLDFVPGSAGRHTWKIVECGNWGNAYPSDDAWLLTSSTTQTVRFILDTNDHSSDAGLGALPAQYIISANDDFPTTTWTAVGDWQGWNNSDPNTAMTAIGNGYYHLTYTLASTGSHQGKVVNNGWENQIGADGRSVNAPAINFQTTTVSETVVFLLDSVQSRLTITNQGSGSGSWCAAGDFQGWNNSSDPLFDDGSRGDLVGGDGVFSLDVTVASSGRHTWKVVECGNWGNTYPSQDAWLNTSVPSQSVKITFDTNDHSGDAGPPLLPTTFIVNAWDDFPTSWTAVGAWQGWDPGNAATLMQAVGHGQFFFSTTITSAGTYDGKVANSGWTNQLGTDGRSVNAPNVPFTTTVNDNRVDFWLDGRQGRLAIVVDAPQSVIPPIDPALIKQAVQHPIQDEVFYFVLPDRFQNGDTLNDTGAISGTVLDHGYLATDKGYFHGGDLAGLALTDTLDYIEGLGISAIWLTPVFGNDPVQGDGTIGGSSAGYHGYWIIDYDSADAHLGTDQELVDFITAAHARGIKVFLDIVTNHTGDIIQYQEAVYDYRDKTDYPYRDDSGVAFDDRDFVLSTTFPALDAAISFPYTPIVNPGDETIKKPDWLNALTYYHNRGNSSFAGENSTYGDFFGLDDLFTEHPDVVTGFIDIFTHTINTYDIDGFRLDTAKHVNIEFWQQVAPAVMDFATNNGKPDFFMFGEVFDYNAGFLSEYTTDAQLPSVLDFGIQGNAYGFAIKSEPTDNLRNFFDADDYFTDADSNAYQLANFVSNHDIGRFGGFIRNELGGSPNAEWLMRSELGHALIYFARGFPVVYYGDEQGFVSDGGDKDAREDIFPSLVTEYNDNDLIGTTATTADDNLDPTHPLYQTLADYSTVISGHLALRRGAQVHRYSQANAGIYAFSRIEAGEQVEYVVALNNAAVSAGATFPVYSANMGFTAVFPLTSTKVISSDGSGLLNVNLPPFGVAVFRANAALAASATAPGVAFTGPAADEDLFDRVELAVTLTDTNRFVEVNFAVKIGSGDYEYIGTDNNEPYRLYYDVSDIPPGTPVTFQAIVNDLHGHYSNNVVSAVVGDPASLVEQYVIVHYHRFAGDYGDFTSDDYNDFWGLHLWGNALHPDELPTWTEPKKFSGIDNFGAYVALRLIDDNQPVNFILHQGDQKDLPNDRAFDPMATPEVWLVQGTYNIYTNPAQALGETIVHYNRGDNTYTDWGLHLWQNGAPPLTTWPTRHLPISFDSFGAVFSITTNVYPSLELTRGLNITVHNGAGSQEPQRTYTPTINYEIWVNDGDTGWYAQPGAATDTATIHYRRCLNDYGDYSSTNFDDFWGLHLWTGALTATQWTEPLKPIGEDSFGQVFEIPLQASATQLAYILHRGDTKDVPADQLLDLAAKGYEIWIVEGDGGNNPLSAGEQFTDPAIAQSIADRVCGSVTVGNIDQQQAYWLAADVIGWDPLAGSGGPISVTLHYTPAGGLLLDANGISAGNVLTLTAHAAGEITGTIAAKFPHLRGIAAWQIAAGSLAQVPDILKGQIAVAAHDASGSLLDATGLQIPGVLDDLFTYQGALGITWSGTIPQRQAGLVITPTLTLWAPTAKSVTLHLFDDASPATTAITQGMTLAANSGVWSITGTAAWQGKYYLYEVEVYVHSTGQVERNLVTDPYALSLSMDSARSQIVDIENPTLKPAGWDNVAKPPLAAPEDITVYELHVRDFSVNDPLVTAVDQGTFKAFTYDGQNGRPGPSWGMQHLLDLEQAGLTHIHLLPVFDIATINEDKDQWLDPAINPLAGPADTQQQAAVTAVEDQDAFNWGYDPFHYSVPEGSYSTVPTGTTRIIEFREMVQTLNENGLRVVMDVVYNHTNASGQNPNSVLDRIVPGYYHRLNDRGDVERSTCCENTASEHNMMEKLMIDSLIMWSTAYKVDAFRFDLMGHHMITNMVNIRTALDTLTTTVSGVDGREIYLYGEGWNFGEVANGARGTNATQLNLAGIGIGTFSDRLRDAVRGGGPFDSGPALQTQGFANGLYYDPNNYNHPFNPLDQLLHYGDWIRAGLAGNLADYAFVTAGDVYTTAANVDYNGQPAGYTADPQEQIIYISKHDNQTLFDINVYAIPTATNNMTDRVRVQNVGLSIVSLSQGVPFFHAGSDLLRSKSLDRDSFNSGDWFNALDFSYNSNNFGVGLPVASKNQTNWPIMTPFLSDPALQPVNQDITLMAGLFQEWMAVRYSSKLFRLETAADIQGRLAYHNTGSAQIPGLIVMTLSDAVPGLADIDPNHELIVVLFNANDAQQQFTAAQLAGMDLTLHPVLAASADIQARMAAFNSGTGTFTVPGRTTAVFVARVVPPTASLQGPGTGIVDAGVTLTASVSPISVTRPITLTWMATDHTAKTTVLSATLTANKTFTWTAPGVKTVTATMENVAGTSVATSTIVISSLPVMTASLQFIHLAPFASGSAGVDVYLDGMRVLSDVVYNSSSGYVTVTAGAHLVALHGTGSPTPAITGSITLTEGTANSLLAAGGANGYPLQLLPLVDNEPVVRRSAGDGYLRLGHLAPFTDTLPATAVNFIDDLDDTAVLTHVVYGEISPYLALAPGDYDLRVERAADSALLFDLVPVTVSDGAFLTAVAAGDGSNQLGDVVALPGKAGPLPSLLVPVYRVFLPVLIAP